MRNLALSALALVTLLAGTGCNKVTTENEPLDLDPWAKSFQGGSDSFVYGGALASGPDGDVFLGGFFSSSVDFGGGYLVSDSGSALFVAHLDKDGNHLFSGSTGSNDSLTATAVGPGGELYVAGNYDGAINFGAGKLTGYKNGYLAGFAPGGASMFNLALGGVAEDWVDDVAVTPSGDVIVGARAGDDANFAGGESNKEYSQKEAVVAVYDAEGALLWTVNIPEAIASPVSVTSDTDGNVLVTGRSWSPIQLGGLSGEAGAFVAKISSTGVPLWLLTTTSAEGNLPDLYDVAVGPEGDVYLSGAWYYGEFQIGGVSSGWVDNSDTFWLRISSKGEVLHMHRLNTPSYYSAPQLAVAPDGQVLVGLTLYYGVDFGGGIVGLGPEQNAVLARFTPEGEHVGSMEIAGGNNEYLNDLAVDPNGDAVVLGWFDSDVELAGTKLTTDQGNAMFVGRIDF